MPQEILSHIAQYTTNDRLAPYTLVNKSWQAAFERRMYSSIILLSPSTTTSITIGPSQQLPKRGLSLARLDQMTSGPQHWRHLRKTYIKKILYRVAVPNRIDSLRTKYDEYTYDNVWRRDNDKAFTEGVEALFEYLSTWTQQSISLEIALQAEYAYVSDTDYDEGHEPETRPFGDGLADDIAPYCANLLDASVLQEAKCITSLEFPDLDIPSRIPCQYSPDGYRSGAEDKISLPAILKIAAACGTLRTLRLDGAYQIPITEPAMRRQVRDATAAALYQLPPTVKSIEYIGDSPHTYDNPDDRLPDAAFRRQDPLSIALHNICGQLKSLHINQETVFPELFCPKGPEELMDIQWPYLETLHLERIDDNSPFSAITRYADGHTDDDVLVERYMDDMYTSIGYAARRMPRIRDLVVQWNDSREVSLGYHRGRWSVSFLVLRNATLVLSARVLNAWGIPEEDGLQADAASCTRYYNYTSWPPV